MRWFFLFLVQASLSAAVITPNGSTLSWTMDNGIKVFQLVAEPVERQFGPGLVVKCWG